MNSNLKPKQVEIIPCVRVREREPERKISQKKIAKNCSISKPHCEIGIIHSDITVFAGLIC